MMADDKPLEDKLLQQERDTKPPRYMLALVDFTTDTQRQVGVHELNDFFEPLSKEQRKLLKATDFWKFLSFFKRLVKTAEADYFKQYGKTHIIGETELTEEQLAERDAAIAAAVNAPAVETPGAIMPGQETDQYNDMTLEERITAAQAFAQEALGTDGEAHKQWYLHEIAQILGVEYDAEEFKEGIKP